MIYTHFEHMAEKEWARAYTDEQYLTKSEVISAMQTSLIDGYWNDILAYRKQFQHVFPFKTITNHPFFLTFSDVIKAKITQFELNSARFAGVIRKISDPHEKEQVERTCLYGVLKAVSGLENAQMSDLSLKALLNGTYQENNPFHAPVIGYEKALRYYLHEKSTRGPIDVDFLAESLAKNYDEEELVHFYRTSDFDSSAQRARYMYNPDYKYAPFGDVEGLMDALLSWLGDGEVPYFVRAIGALYYLDYVKPFEERNDEMASLLAKTVYASSDEGLEAYLLPFENVLLKSPRYNALALESQRSGDLTYLVLYAIGVMSPLLDNLSEQIKAIKIETYRGEFQNLEGPEKSAAEAIPAGKKGEQMSLFDLPDHSEEAPSTPVKKEETPVSPAPEVKPSDNVPPRAVSETPAPKLSVPPTIPVAEVKVAPVPTPAATPVEEKVLPVEEKPHAEAAPTPVPETPKKSNTLAPSRVIAPSELETPAPEEKSALALPSNTLSDREIKEYVEYLLETNPHLNKNQASFFANHCTLGRYYTIQQFKQFAKVAYETARTSMDKLASEGYYEKLQVKNKFVYTPIKKGEKA